MLRTWPAFSFFQLEFDDFLEPRPAPSRQIDAFSFRPYWFVFQDLKRGYGTLEPPWRLRFLFSFRQQNNKLVNTLWKHGSLLIHAFISLVILGVEHRRHVSTMYHLIAILALASSMFFNCKGIDRATGVHLLPEMLLTFLCVLFSFEFVWVTVWIQWK